MNPSQFALVVAAATLVGLLAAAALAVLIVSGSERRRLEQRLLGPSAVTDEFAGAGDHKLLQAAARQGKRIEKLFDGKGETARLLAQAGWREAGQRLMFYALHVLLPAVLVLLLLIVAAFHPALFANPLRFVILLLIAAGLGFLAPRWLLRQAAARRRQQIRREIPLFVNILVMLFEAGLSTRQAFASFVREGFGVVPALGTDLAVILRQLEAGGELSEVLNAYARSMDIPDLSTVIGLLRQVDRYGGEVRQPLQEALQVIEERRTLELRERVNLMSGRMTVVMVVFFFPALLMFVAAPAFIAIIKALSHLNGR